LRPGQRYGRRCRRPHRRRRRGSDRRRGRNDRLARLERLLGAEGFDEPCLARIELLAIRRARIEHALRLPDLLGQLVVGQLADLVTELQLVLFELRLFLAERERVDERLQLPVLGARLSAQRRALLLERGGALQVVLRYARVDRVGDTLLLLVGLGAILRDAVVFLTDRDETIQARHIDGLERIEK